jgi:hypothetical protein
MTFDCKLPGDNLAGSNKIRELTKKIKTNLCRLIAYIGLVRSKTTKLIFAAYPPSTQHYEQRRVCLGGHLLRLKISSTLF